MSKPWEVAAPEAKGDATPSEIFTAVGAALTQWEGLESNLAMTFAALCNASWHSAAESAFGIVPGSATRRDMVMAAYRCFPSREDPTVAGLPNLVKRIGEFSARRNDIAHGTVYGMGEDAEQGYFLGPPRHHTRKRTSMEAIANLIFAAVQRGEDPDLGTAVIGHYAYTAAQIDEYRRQFELLNVEMQAMFEAVIALNASNPQEVPTWN